MPTDFHVILKECNIGFNLNARMILHVSQSVLHTNTVIGKMTDLQIRMLKYNLLTLIRAIFGFIRCTAHHIFAANVWNKNGLQNLIQTLVKSMRNDNYISKPWFKNKTRSCWLLANTIIFCWKLVKHFILQVPKLFCGLLVGKKYARKCFPWNYVDTIIISYNNKSTKFKSSAH